MITFTKTIAFMATIAILQAHQVLADCIADDIILQWGESTGSLASRCVDGHTYQEVNGVCIGNTIRNTPVIEQCGGSTPYCVQCDTPDPGAALCLSSPELPPDCPGPVPEPISCVVDIDIILFPGQPLGDYHPTECKNSTHIGGFQRKCANIGGLIVDEEVLEACPEKTQCVDLGNKDIQCIGEPLDVLAGEQKQFQLEKSEESVRVSCRADDILLLPGDINGVIGYECLNSTHFDGQMSVCSEEGELVNVPALEQACPDIAPVCVQTAIPRFGAAICVDGTVAGDLWGPGRSNPRRSGSLSAGRGGLGNGNRGNLRRG